jgi:hypothetical protein
MDEKRIAKSDRFHEVMVRYKDAMNTLGTGFLIMGECIRDIKQEQLWRLDGNHLITFRQWVEGELRISYSQAMRLIQVFEQAGRFLIKPEFRGMDIYKVVLLLPYFEGKTDEEKEQMLYEAQELKIKDLQDNLRERRGLVATDTCAHDVNILWNQCEKCKRFWR